MGSPGGLFPPETPCYRSSSFTFGPVARGSCLFASQALGVPQKAPCSALLPTRNHRLLLLPSAEKPLIRGRGTWLQPPDPLSRGQSRSVAEIWEVAEHAPFLIWEALGDLAGLPSLPSPAPGHRHGNKRPVVTLGPFITQFSVFHPHPQAQRQQCVWCGRGLGMWAGQWGCHL